MLSEKTIRYSHEFASVFLGVDALYRAHPDGDHIGLVIMNLAEGAITPTRFADIDQALTHLLDLQYRSVDLPEPDRRLFYQQLCHTTASILKWLRDGLPFPDRIRDFLHLDGIPPSASDLDSFRTQMQSLLTDMGYHGDLRAQCAEWEKRNRVPPDEVKQVMEVLLDEGWERTHRLISIPATKDDGLSVVTLSSDHFNARCDYRTRIVAINIDPVITRPALKHLVVHEAYPGHYVQFKIRQTHYHNGTGTAEALFSMLKSPSSCLFEGLADSGMHLLEWFEGDDDRFIMLMNRYQAGIAAAASWRLHHLGLAHDDVRNWLRDQALIGGEAWVSHRMGYISPKQRGMHIWSYWKGEPILTSVWERIAVDDRPVFLDYLFGRLHSPQTVHMFEQNQSH
jgi:hypothetical protein